MSDEASDCLDTVEELIKLLKDTVSEELNWNFVAGVVQVLPCCPNTTALWLKSKPVLAGFG